MNISKTQLKELLDDYFSTPLWGRDVAKAGNQETNVAEAILWLATNVREQNKTLERVLTQLTEIARRG